MVRPYTILPLLHLRLDANQLMHYLVGLGVLFRHFDLRLSYLLLQPSNLLLLIAQFYLLCLRKSIVHALELLLVD